MLTTIRQWGYLLVNVEAKAGSVVPFGAKPGSVSPFIGDDLSAFIGEDLSAREAPGAIFNLSHLLPMLRARWRLIASVSLVLLIIATIVTFTLTPRYTAAAIITLDQRKNAVTDADAILSGLTSDAATVQGQIQILRSRSLITRVMDKAHLENDPEFNRLIQSESKFQWLTDLVPTLIPASWFKMPLTINTPEEEAQDVKDEVIDTFLKGLTVSPEGFSQAIRIEFHSGNAQKTARITNAIVDTYLEDQLNAKLEASEQASGYLSGRLNELNSQVQTAEAAVARYKADHDLMGVGQGISSLDQQVGAINSQLVIAQLSLTEQMSKVGRIRELQRAHNVDVAQEIDSPLIIQLRNEESALLRQEVELSSKYAPRHPRIIDLQTQIANLERKIEDAVSRVIQVALNDVDIAKARVNSLQQGLDELERRVARRNESLVALRQLEQNAASTHSLYDAFLSRFKQIDDRGEIQRPDARILSSAAVPREPTFPPSKTLILGAATPVSLFLGLMAAILRELFVNGFRTAAQLEKSLGLRVIATAPEVKGKRGKSPVSNIVNEDPDSPFAESMRGIQLRLTQFDLDQQPKVILVTSAIQGEGKSTVALSLARTYARNGKKVVLLDCDFRRPTLHKMVQAGEIKSGLMQAMFGGENVENCLYKDPHSEVLLLAPETSVKSPNDFLASAEMETLIQTLRGMADWVIIDSPPVLPVNDTKLLIRMVDTMLLMVRWERTPRDAVSAAIRSLVDLHAPIAGVVITRAEWAESYNHYYYGNYAPKSYSLRSTA